MLQFSSIRLTEDDPKLSVDNVNKQILAGNCEDIGVVLTLSQALLYNIQIDADNILGLTKIDMRRAADVNPDVKSPSFTAAYEAQDKYDRNSYLMHGGNNLPEAPLTMERRRQILEEREEGNGRSERFPLGDAGRARFLRSVHKVKRQIRVSA